MSYKKQLDSKFVENGIIINEKFHQLVFNEDTNFVSCKDCSLYKICNSKYKNMCLAEFIFDKKNSHFEES